MASEKQIAANQRNARKSTGPRSREGKRRSSRNAYRHGLSINSSVGSEKQLNKLARKIAGRTEETIMLEHARAAAQAELDLARVRRVKVALIGRVMGDLDMACSGSDAQPIQVLNPSTPASNSSSVTAQRQDPDRAHEADRVLLELLKLDRYERRASARRDRALRQITDRK